jgi:thioredoxin reductase (NADPH)
VASRRAILGPVTPARLPERAVVLAVDDAPDDLARLRSELSKRYGDDYDVRVAASPSAALGELEELRAAQLPVAVVLASQWMAEMRGTELLRRAGELHPTAKRGLLISWGDRSVADPILEAMATGRLDHYVPKPMTAPDEGFHSLVKASSPTGRGPTAEASRRSSSSGISTALACTSCAT